MGCGLDELLSGRLGAPGDHIPGRLHQRGPQQRLSTVATQNGVRPSATALSRPNSSESHETPGTNTTACPRAMAASALRGAAIPTALGETADQDRREKETDKVSTGRATHVSQTRVCSGEDRHPAAPSAR